ncbi:cytochrome c oxidase accessory protein CcoG [Roseimaritima sediminicola]|uniref:cytochrome c oxidase accessory protein CcoG n=1 Tax=Roseimaritima sediminicola TaxID=2662066 RepID=UPI0012983BB7|nr:cytochrome c oxidase accessory protein CcoG [Roseimaritima sediminicola]
MTSKQPSLPIADPVSSAETPVLSTLELDGRRRWLYPRLAMGTWWRWRRIVAYALMVIFVLIPHLRIGGKPVLLLDVTARRFTILGKTFLPTDTVPFVLLWLGIFLSIVLITAVAGRVWCGWGCPQTVYMEYLFRPIDRLFEGTVGKGGLPRRDRSPLWQVARVAVYVVLCMFLAHTFLAYFVGTERLAQWMRASPLEQPAAFLVMAGTTVAMLFDFLYFREQMCTLACPYGRLQSVMLDSQSLIVAYDPVRGEPRKKGKHAPGDNAGDCVDCNRCVVVCPTGIDIRDGLQMECINCTQCIDACDDVMRRVGTPTGLIRYSSQDAIAGKPQKLWRLRTVLYPLILLVVFAAFTWALLSMRGFDAQIVRGRGAPFSMTTVGVVSNSYQVRLLNRSEQPQTYRLSLADAEGATLSVIDAERLTLEPDQRQAIPLTVSFPIHLTLGQGSHAAGLVVSDEQGNQRELKLQLIGPR